MILIPYHFYGEIAINGGKKEFEHFSEPLNKRYKVNVYSPEKNYFIMQFIDITNEINQFTEMERLVEISEEFLQMDGQKICYKKISDDFMKICGAKYASFNLFDENGKGFTTMAISGEKEIIKKASNILGLKFENKKWEHDLVRSEKIKARTITRFNSLSELVGNVLPIPLVALLEKTFNIGETVLIKILKNNIIIGDFTLIMEKGKRFDKDTLAEIYTRQLGIVITRKKAEENLKDSEDRIQLMFKNHNAVMLLIEPKSGRILDSNFAAAKFYDYSIGQLNSMFIDEINIMSANEIKKEKAKASREERNYFIFNHKLKNGEVRLVEVHSSHINYKGTSILFSIIHDITQRKHVEDLLKVERERLENIIQGTNSGTYELNEQTGETVFNERWAEIIGYTLDEISPVSVETWTKFTHPEDMKKVENQLNRVYTKKKDYYDVERRMKHKDGSWVWVQDKGKVMSWTSDGKPLLVSGMHTDISDRKRAEALANRRNLFQKLIADISTDLINATVGNIDKKINNMLKVSGEFFEVDISGVIEISPDERKFTNVHEWCAEGISPVMACAQGLPLDSLPWWSDKLRCCESVNISDMNKLPETAMEEKEFIEISQIQSLLNIQITNNNLLIGALVYISIRDNKVWEEDQIVLLKVLGNTVSNALAKNKMEREILEAKDKAEKENSLKTEFLQICLTNSEHLLM